MIATAGAGAVLLVLGDYDDERCGVGTSEATTAADAPGSVRVIDPSVGSLRSFRRDLRAAGPGAAGAVVAYPTIHTFECLALLPRLALLRTHLRGGRWLRVHLHEFEQLRRRHRVAVAAVTGLVADRIVVSSAWEADGLRGRYRGWGGRSEVVVVPPANRLAPPSPPSVRPSDPDGRTVGIIGQLRPDKGEGWLLDQLARLDGRYSRVEVVGRDWDLTRWPAALHDRYQLVLHGQVAGPAVAGVLAGWDLAIAPYEGQPHDGRLSLRTPLAYGVPTLTRGPRPAHLQLRAPHLLFDDEVDVGHLPDFGVAERSEGAAVVAALEVRWRAALADALFGP